MYDAGYVRLFRSSICDWGEGEKLSARIPSNVNGFQNAKAEVLDHPL